MAVVLPGTWVYAGLSADADPIGSTQAEIAQLQSQITNSAARIHLLTQAYGQAQLVATNLAQEIQANTTQEGALTHKVATSLRTLRREAIASYAGSTQDAVLSAAQKITGLPQVQSEYLNVAENDLGTTVSQLRFQRVQLGDVRANLKTEERASRQALREAADARGQALRQAAQEQVQLNQEQSHLAQLQAQAAAAQAQAAAAAQARAQAAAASQTRRPAQTSPTTTSSQGLGTNLVASVKSQLNTSTSTTSTTPTTSTTDSTTTTTTGQSTTTTGSPPTTTSSGGGGAGGVWLELRECESGDNYQENTGNGFYGAYQFSASTWTALGYPGLPSQEPPAMQDAAAKKLQAESGWGQWPACSATLGLT